MRLTGNGALAGTGNALRVIRLSITLESHRRVILRNGAFLIAQTGVSSFLGFVFWVVAARTVSSDQVGVGAAYISAATLLAMIADLGLSTTVIRFASSMGTRQAVFINSAGTAVSLGSLAAALIFALGTPLWSPTMGTLTHSAITLGTFAAATALLRLTLLLDDVFVAFEVTHFVLIRNVVSNIVRVAIVLVAARLLGATGLVLAVAVGALAGVLVTAMLVPRVVPGYRMRPALHWHVLRETAAYSLGNHFANILWGIPSLVYPLIVVGLLGAATNAQFYVSWMMANLLYVLPASLSLSMFARAVNVGHLDETPFWRMIWLTLASLLVPTLGLIAFAPFLLRVFGHHYSAQNPWLLVLLALSVFPYSINTITITFHRVAHHTAQVIVVSGLTTAACLVTSVALGARYALPGVGAGWLIGQIIGVGISLSTHTTAHQYPRSTSEEGAQLGGSSPS